jgi:hypothetical protein
MKERQRIVASFFSDHDGGKDINAGVCRSRANDKTATDGVAPSCSPGGELDESEESCLERILANGNEHVQCHRLAASGRSHSSDESAESSTHSSPQSVVPGPHAYTPAQLPQLGELLPFPRDMAALGTLRKGSLAAATGAGDWAGLLPGHGIAADDTQQEALDEEDAVPLDVATEACVVRRALCQYACTSMACLRYDNFPAFSLLPGFHWSIPMPIDASNLA